MSNTIEMTGILLGLWGNQTVKTKTGSDHNATCPIKLAVLLWKCNCPLVSFPLLCCSDCPSLPWLFSPLPKLPCLYIVCISLGCFTQRLSGSAAPCHGYLATTSRLWFHFHHFPIFVHLIRKTVTQLNLPNDWFPCWVSLSPSFLSTTFFLFGYLLELRRSAQENSHAPLSGDALFHACYVLSANLFFRSHFVLSVRGVGKPQPIGCTRSTECLNLACQTLRKNH